MHRIAATPGGWQPDSEGVIIVEQTPAPIIILTAADTDIQILNAAVSHLPTEFPPLRTLNLLQLQQQLSIDSYADTVLTQAKVIILRLLGGRSYWSYGLEVVKETVEETGAALYVLPGDDRPDPDLISHSTVSLAAVHRLWRYFVESGVDNLVHAVQFVADVSLGTSSNPPPPQVVPRIGLYHNSPRTTNKVGIIFYRSHYLAGNTLPIDSLILALQERNLSPLAVFVSSLGDQSVQAELFSYLQDIQILLNTTSFSVAKLNQENPKLELWQKLNVPVLQVILSGSTIEQWKSSYQGLTPRDVAMNVALPEVDGRIITRAVSFKSVQTSNQDLETDVVVYQPNRDRVNFVADITANWLRLINTPTTERKIALILANYPNKNGRIANGVGLDTPASCIAILQALQAAGYFVQHIPSNGDELIARLTAGITNDPESKAFHPVNQYLSQEDYNTYFSSLPEQIQQEISDRWSHINPGGYPIPGIQLGNIFIGIQPSRGYDKEPSLNYHAPDLEPTHDYLAYYYWLREHFRASGIIHLGKHGNLEWLPGKSLALSSHCYPEIALLSLPNFYPFIVNDPGEGSQAKRRSQAVIIDHLTPSMTRAELYDDLQQLEALIDEYYEAQSLDPSRLTIIGDRILNLVTQSHLDKDLGCDTIDKNSLDQFLTLADSYLCALKDAQIRDGLHIFGQMPQGRQLRDLIGAIARFPTGERLGLSRAIARDLEVSRSGRTHFLESDSSWKRRGEDLEEQAEELIEGIIGKRKINPPGQNTRKELEWIERYLLPALEQTYQEISNLLRGLDGKYVPSGAAGAPTRGRPEVLPTGRNFYSVDIRAIPTETAWEVGRKAAEAVIERYTQENGEYPQTLVISVWGTSTMRTGGDDIAQVLALLGVRPIWDGISRRVVDFEILTPSALGRPRVDVTLRISGFFRDSFPNLIDLVSQAITAVSNLEETEAENPLATQVRKETKIWQQQGLPTEEAAARATMRIFGSKPGAYGAGLQGLIEAQNWTSDEDLARAYLNWSSYGYSGAQHWGVGAAEAFEQRLERLQVVLHNQDNREHDLLDSDDYYQFQGGLTVAVRALTGKNPQTYFGDNSLPELPQVRQLSAEIARVYRSRVINPKWIAGVMRHGYKGAFEMAATVDYLFAYDATVRCVRDDMYQGVAEAYLFEPKVQQFLQKSNPWALRDMAERLLEASQRRLWETASNETLDELRLIVHQAEASIEA